jgi:sterol desaturase/sphingolipid hydroxylase (fatty acid hydroxylase superfamily)
MATILRLSVGLAALALFFALAHRLGRREHPARKPGRAVRTDVAWWFFVGTVGQWLTRAGVVVVVAATALPFADSFDRAAVEAWATRETALSGQPVLLQALEVLVLVDFLGYWVHRGFHRFGPAWRVHAVHHSSTQLTWLSAVRVHPINDAVPNMVGAAVLVLAGFDLTTLAVAVPFFTLYAIAVHADLDWTYGPLRHVIASPVFHRWHHSTEAEALDKNFAGLLPVWDALFGTLHLPATARPATFGLLGPQVPEAFWPQLTYPFRGGRRGDRRPGL